MIYGGGGGVAAAIAQQNAANAASNAAAANQNCNLSIMDAKHVYSLVVDYAVIGGEIMYKTTEKVVEKYKGLFGTINECTTYKKIHKPLIPTVKEMLPKDAVVIQTVFDWYNGWFRVYYTKPSNP